MLKQSVVSGERKMLSRERVLEALEHREPDRVPVYDAPWLSTVKRWKKEGMPEDSVYAEFFDYDLRCFRADLSPRLPVKVIEKNDLYITETTPEGGIRRNFRDYSTTPEIVDWPVKSRADWERIKDRLKPDFRRVDWATGLRENGKAFSEGKFLAFNAASGYDALQRYIKSENLLMAMAEDAEWVREMATSVAELIIATAGMMADNGFKMDAAFLANDLGYRNALLFSPEIYRKTHLEADRMMMDYFHGRGMKTILHSCGCVKELIPLLIEAGFDCLQPLEVKAGMDLVELKEKYGKRLSFMGGIDVRLMSDPDAGRIEDEISTKFEASKKGGGYIYHSDHSIPDNVSFRQYERVMALVRKYGEYGG